MIEGKAHLPTYDGCLLCGRKEVNPSALNLRFQTTDGGVEGYYVPDSRQEGFKGIVHGGVLCALLDEVIGWAAAVERKRYFVTAELTVRFLRPLPVGTAVTVRGRVREHLYRLSTAEGEIVDESGNMYAKATGKFMMMPENEAGRVHEYLTFREGDVDILE